MSYFAGSWVNVYNSLITLYDGDDGYLYGSYSSTTGASGTYHVVGYGSPKTPTSAQGVGVSLALLWRSYQGGTPDPSWHWVSGFGGQGILDANGNKTISLNHALVATDDDPGVGNVGTYLDKLLYTPHTSAKVEPAHDHRKKHAKGAGTDPIDGNWICASANVRLSIAVQDAASGFVQGTITIGTPTFPLAGFADNGAEGAGLTFEGLTVSCFVNGHYVVMCGSLDRSAGTLTLLRMVSSGTPSGLAFMQTSAQALTFVRG